LGGEVTCKKGSAPNRPERSQGSVEANWNHGRKREGNLGEKKGEEFFLLLQGKKGGPASAKRKANPEDQRKGKQVAERRKSYEKERSSSALPKGKKLPKKRASEKNCTVKRMKGRASAHLF